MLFNFKIIIIIINNIINIINIIFIYSNIVKINIPIIIFIIIIFCIIINIPIYKYNNWNIFYKNIYHYYRLLDI